MKERFLPIGTVLLLKGGKKEVMITSYCIFPTNIQIKEGKAVKPDQKMYEYGGCIYPEGILDTSMSCAFNHSQIEKIVHMGYENEEYKKLSERLNKGYDEYKEIYEKEGIEGIQKLSQQAVAKAKLEKQQKKETESKENN